MEFRGYIKRGVRMSEFYRLVAVDKDNKELDYYKRKSMRLQQEKQQLKDNWNKLKEYIEKDYGFYDKLIAPKYGCAMGALRRIKDKMQKLEQGSDSNE